jgi:hypothetical protein
MPRDAAGKAGDARGDEARKAGKAATTTNASTTTTSSTPGQAPVVHESQDTYISQLPDPSHVDAWLKLVEKMLNIAQCFDRENVLLCFWSSYRPRC